MENTNVIAWLLPSSTNLPAMEAVRIPQNAARRVEAVPSSYDPVVQTPNPDAAPSTPTIDPSVLTRTSSPSGNPRPALELSFTSPPRNHVGFVLGTDPDVCDVVLPPLVGISPVHCHITFDADRRLVLRDTSEAGTAVWYDGASSGDRRRESWALSAGCTYAFPAMVDRVVVDIQTVRFQVLVNESHMLRPDAYRDSVDAFMASLASGCSVVEEGGEGLVDEEEEGGLVDGVAKSIVGKLPVVTQRDDELCDFYYNFDFDLGFGLTYGDHYDYGYDLDYDMLDDDDAVDDVDDCDRIDFLPSVPSVVPPVYVKYLLTSDDGAPPETYLWNTTRPWEPMIKVAC
ncbi:hypothetical protein CGRA01v4_11093 [Colletotrichum graminicola]|uniref:FHA domain-containing protein n=1 Tax=Colletotrichum graminicola (strain M1.001 / M2 / FGSC 10212) TaxID=645133 RepID=E3QKV8_COLGM|nr:uncharacterized protein GLRG_06640 [Colletotrichum graminicola M1.001]EFQ31496.1 hypothetical protein GLRG_06640 [Colletotrichum graminicola M1.001]WDK19806.1 hypothetical protein CGRA01v4_11093 [Colletotrichum graminicola]